MSDPRSLFEPSSIAIAGASDRPGPGRQVLENLAQFGYSCTIIPINPEDEKIRDCRRHSSLATLELSCSCKHRNSICTGSSRYPVSWNGVPIFGDSGSRMMAPASGRKQPVRSCQHPANQSLT
ncbi:CoA-binding protein [Candidatus Bipolaricaulota bacterium]